ncbi:MAG: hypothetical protein RL591_1298 [Planctomycetota bacterium]|jgi:branched-chain amino acid transport system substrate-binding protein
MLHIHRAPRFTDLVASTALTLAAMGTLVGCATKSATNEGSVDSNAALPRIACVFEPTGPAAVLDVAALQGAMVAREEAGNVPWGVDIVSIAGAEEAAKTAIAALGTTDSDELRAGFAPFAAAKTPFLVVGATDPCLARLPGGDLLSFACYSDSAQGAAMAEFAHGQLKARKIAILFEATSDFPVAVSQAFAARARGLDGTQVTAIAFTDAMKVDPKAVLGGAFKPDAVYVACNATSVVPVIDTLRSAGFQGAILGADSFDIPDVNTASKQGAVYFSTHAWFGAGASAAAKRFAEKYRAEFQTEPTAFSALGYDAMQAMVRAMQSLPPERRTREGMAGALRSLAPHAGITGEIAFPKPGYFAAKPVWIVTVEGGARVRATQVLPTRIPEPNCER